jgi:hypothetical protein
MQIDGQRNKPRQGHRHSVGSTRLHAPPLSPTLDRHYERLRQDLQPVFEHLGIAA